MIRRRRISSRIGVLLAAVAVAASITVATGSVGAGAAPLSIRITGNHFEDGDGQVVRLLGVNVPSTEYACEQGWGYSGVTNGAATAAAIAAWHANAVRVPLNEDCWLGLNGQPSGSGETALGYRQFIETWVADLNAQGIYAILELHWSAPGTTVADGQRPMPDDHSAAFWSSVATTFLNNPAVVFDLFNEPYSPAADGYTTWPVSWACWLNGGCSVPVTADGINPGTNPATYTAVGMQALVTAVRSTGASQPLMVGGLSYSNDLSGWLAHEPIDPAGQLAASFHNYDGNGGCDQLSCWNATIAPVATQVPVVTGELGQGYDCQGGPSNDGFDLAYMEWADQEGIGYLVWAWWELAPDPATTNCSAEPANGSDTYAVIDDSGNPLAPDGTALHSHLLALFNAATTPPTTVPTTTVPTTAVPTTVPTPAPTTPVAAGTNPGYDLVGSDGGVFVFPIGGSEGFYGSLPGLSPPVRVSDVVGIVPTADDRGYFLVGSDGGVFAFGDTTFEGSLPGVDPAARIDDIVGIVPTADDRGYFLVGSDGGVFAFGDAPYLGSLPGEGTRVHDVVGIAADARGSGYWVIEANGVVHAFGTASALGNATSVTAPVTAIVATPDGAGYWVLTADGGVQSFGDAAYHGSLPGLGAVPAARIVSLVPTEGGSAYSLIGSDGGVFSFNGSPYQGSLPGDGVRVGDIVGAVATSG